MLIYLILKIISALTGLGAIIILFIHLARHKAIQAVLKEKGIYIPIFLLLLSLTTGYFSHKTYAPDFAMPMFMHSQAPGGLAPTLPFKNIFSFFLNQNNFEKIADISANPEIGISKPQQPDADGVVRIYLRAQEVLSEIAPDVYQNYWTFNKQVPGPMLHIREGDIVEITLENDASSLHDHNIDLHAVTGAGGGASLTDVAPGEKKTFRFKALNPGLFEYHCAMPNVSSHNSHGQYGLILVDPLDEQLAFSRVDREFYVMQGEFYATGGIGKRGLMQFDTEGLLNGTPTYVVFNGKVESTPRLHAKVGEKIRMYVGNGGVNLISSFHVIGEIFDTVYPEAAIGIGSAIFKNVQTTAVLPGGATIVEFTVDVPGKFLLVDHALARMNKGAWAVLEVTGDEQPDIFTGVPVE